MNLEDITLKEISQTEKDKYGMISLMWGTNVSVHLGCYNKNTTD